MNYSAILSDIDFLLGTDTTAYSLADKTANVNRHFEDVVSKIIQFDYNWRWDDSNFTTLPIGTTDLVAGQQDYSLSSQTFLKVLRVEVLDSDGNYQLIKPINEDDIKVALTEYESVNGMPKAFRALGDSLFLYPAPASGSVTLTAGLKVYYQRPHDPFLTSDTTKTPGFNPLFHRLLSLGASLDYSIAHNMRQKQAIITPLYNDMMRSMEIAYSQRPSEDKGRMLPRVENTR